MNGIAQLGRSWHLFKSSVAVIFRKPKLLAFPLVTGILTLGIFLFFFGAAALRPTGHPWTSGEHWQSIAQSLFSRSGPANSANYSMTVYGAALLAFLYFASMFFATFFNVAFYHEILEALCGEAVSIRRGLAFASTRWKAILLWTIFAGLVGLIIKEIERRVSFVGSIIARFLGLAWSLASVFAIPVIIRDDSTSNPIEIVKKSAQMLRSTWGEALIGYIGLAVGNMVVLFLTFGAIITAAVVGFAFHSFWPVAAVGVIWLITLIAFTYVMNVASQVYRGALYLYAAENVVAEPYNREMLDQAWKWKK